MADDPLTDDDLAAEYVLGVQDAETRDRLAQRITWDLPFAERVTAWEARFADLNDEYVPEKPPRRVKSAIDTALFGESRPRRSWFRFAAGLISGVAVMLLAVVLFLPGPRAELTAELRADGSDFAFVAEVTQGRLAIDLAAGVVPEDRVLELWQIVEGGAPVSLGLVGADLTAPAVPFAEGQILAVSLEPPGGSPTGAPTGMVLALGELKKSQEG